MIGPGRATTWLAAALLAGCATRPAPAPEPAPVVRSEPAVEAAPAASPAATDWTDLPLTPGAWSYVGGAGSSEARFAGLVLRCDTTRRQVSLARDGAGGPIGVRTSYGERTLPPGAALPAEDPLLDQLAFSRGRFTIEAPGQPTLVVPAWPEPSRVIEDCRG